MSLDEPEKAFVQGEGVFNGRTPQDIPVGYIDWDEHKEAWNAYHKRWANGQSALTINMRGGFGYWELVMLLGHAPRTWRPRVPYDHRDFIPAEKKEKRG